MLPNRLYSIIKIEQSLHRLSLKGSSKFFFNCSSSLLPWPSFKSEYRCTHTVNTNSTIKYISIYENAIKHWDNIAIEDRNRRYTYGEIYSKSLNLTDDLKSILNEKKQERIVFLLPNDASYVISQWATWRANHIAVPLHPLHPPPQLKYFVENSKSNLIITCEDLNTKFSKFLSDLNVPVIVLENSVIQSQNDEQLKIDEEVAKRHACNSEELIRNETDSVALIIYTSGTTGPPKGVVLTHGNLQSQAECLLSAWKWTSKDVLLHCLPLHHMHGIVNALLCPLYCGASVMMEPQFNANSVWAKLVNLDSEISMRVNMFMAVPTMYAKLIDEYEHNWVQNDIRSEFIRKACMENIRLMVSGSAPLPETILEKWQEITGHVLLERYGMSEIGMALSNPLNGKRYPGFVGNPLPGVQVKIVQFSPKRDSYKTICEGNHKGTVVMTGFNKAEPGELLVKGPNVFREYYEKKEETEKEFTKDGWFCTGDTSAFIDGKYKILGRTSVDIIKTGGFKVSAIDVETLLLSHPNISDIAVFGVPDVTWGEKVVALVVWNEETPFDLLELRSWAKERLPHYQVPSLVKILPELPRNNMGKVNKKQLQNKYFPA